MSASTNFEIARLGVPLQQIADTLSASQKDLFVRLPGLLAYWPMGIRGLTGNVLDHSGAGRSLFETGVCPTGYDGNAFVHLGNGTNFLDGLNTFGVDGLETFISSSIRGLTMGGWFMIDSSPTTPSGLISKDGATPDRGYLLGWLTTDQPIFLVSGTGAAINSVTAPVSTLSVWHFLVGRYTPSTEVAVFVDGDKTVTTTAIPASLNISAQAFEIGRYLNDNNRIIHGKIRDLFICAAALSDAQIEEIRVTSTP